MIGIDRETGATLDDWDQFVSRVTQVLTTPVGAREHRRAFGSRVRETLGKFMGDDLLLRAQAYALEAFYEPANGIGDFKPEQVIASREGNGLRLRFVGAWKNRRMTFEVAT